MTIFKLSCAVTVSAYTEVEAETLEAAIKIAAARDVQIGGLHTGVDPEETWTIEEADGSPTDIHPSNG